MQLEVLGGRDEGEGGDPIEERVYENIIVGASKHIKKCEGVDGGPVEELLEEVVAGTQKLIPWINIMKYIKLVLWVILVGLIFKHSVFPLENQAQLVVPSERSPSSSSSSERSNPDFYCGSDRPPQEGIKSFKERKEQEEEERQKLIYSLLRKLLLPLSPSVGSLREEATEQSVTGPKGAPRSESENSIRSSQWVEKEGNTNPPEWVEEEEEEEGGGQETTAPTISPPN